MATVNGSRKNKRGFSKNADSRRAGRDRNRKSKEGKQDEPESESNIQEKGVDENLQDESNQDGLVQEEANQRFVINENNVGLAKDKIKELQKELTRLHHQPNEAERIKPQISRLQSAVQKWRNKRKELEKLGTQVNDELDEEDSKEPPFKRRRLDNKNEKLEKSTTESISIDDNQANFVINSLMDRVTQLQGQISGLQTLTQQQNENANTEIKNLRAQLQLTANNLCHSSFDTSFSLQDVFQRPTLSKFSSTVSPDANHSDTIHDNIPRDDQLVLPAVSNEEKLDIKKKSNQTRLNLALKLNFKFNNKAPKLTIEALKFRNNVKNWERIGRTVLGWSDDCALLSVKLAFTDVSDFNDF